MAVNNKTVGMMSFACAVSVANMYYCQPLLANMGVSFGAGAQSARYLPMWTQAGTAVGMFAFVPLGDMFPRRGLIVAVCIASAVTAGAMGFAPALPFLMAAGFATGLTAIVPHLVLPFAAKLAPDETRGQVVGTVVSGLLLGILLARVVAGFVGDAFGWRSIYLGAAAMMLALAGTLRMVLPHDRPESQLGYGELTRSIVRLTLTQPVLREAAVTGAMSFGAFSSFWATLTYFLATPPYHYGAKTAGIFGLVGAAGALIAPRAGKLADRKGPGFTVTAGLITALAGFAVFQVAGRTLAGLVAGVLLLDLGVQAGHVANQTRIYALVPEARSRLNTVYMVSYFLGGSAGSALGAFGWLRWGWTGVCAAGAAQILVGLAVRYAGR